MLNKERMEDFAKAAEVRNADRIADSKRVHHRRARRKAKAARLHQDLDRYKRTIMRQAQNNGALQPDTLHSMTVLRQVCPVQGGP